MPGFRKLALDLSEFFHLSLDWMCIAASDGRVLACNQAFLDGGGRTAEEWETLNYFSVIHPADLAYFASSIKRMAQGEAVPLLSFRFQHKNGRWIHSEWSCQPRDGLLYASGRDVSQRVESEARLAEATKRYETLARLAPVGIFLSAADGSNLFANDKLCEINGLTRAESAGLAWMERIHQDDRHIIQKQIESDVKRGAIFDAEYRVQIPGGRVRWVHTLAEPQRDEHGQIAGYIGTVEDISERRQRQHLLGLAGRIAKVGGWELDAATQEIDWSCEILALIEAEPDQSPTLAEILSLYGEEDRPRVMAIIEDAISQGRAFEYEAEISTFKGKRIWVHVAGEPELADGQCVRLSGVLQDITERVAARQAERAASEKLRLLFERAPLGMALQRLDGSYVDANRSFLNILGTDLSVLRRSNHAALLPDAEVEAAELMYASLLSSGAYGPTQQTWKRRDASELPVVVNAVLVRDEGGDEYIWMVVEDVSISRRMEEARIEHERLLTAANRALEESNREIEEFTYAASHDLKEPLRTIMGFCELLEEDLKTGDAASIAEDMRAIRGGAHRMQRLVDDLLALSRSGKQALNMEPMPLAACFLQARQDLASLIERTGAIVEYQDLPDVSCDAEHVTRVFQNMLSNAIKYQRKGATPHIRVSGEVVDGMCEVRVADNGIGIDPRYHDVVFNAFKRLHGQSEYEGSGIGLAMCRKTIERHGGTIRLDSEPGVGTTFIFTLPLAAQQCVEAAHG